MCRSLSAFGVTALMLAVITDSRRKCPSNGFQRFAAQTNLKLLDSPHFPYSYANNLNCTWLIEAPNDDHYIRLETNTMDMETSNNCSHDSLSIYNGQLTSSPLLGRFCGKTAISTTSTGRRMLVVLATDSSAGGKFQLRVYGVNTKPTTTVRTTTRKTTASTTETSKEVKAEEHKEEELNTWLVVGGILGGVVFLIILGTVCMRCTGGRGPQHPPVHRPAAFYHAHAPPNSDTSAVSAAVHMVQNNNTVFMVHQATGGAVSPSHLASISSDMAGVTNMAFSSSRDQINASISSTYNFLAPPSGIPPPPIYTDDMLVKFPPKIAPSPRRPPPAPSSGSHAATGNDDTVRRDGTAGDGVTAPTFVTSRDNATNVTDAASSPRVAASPVRSQRGPETPTRGGNVGRDGTAGRDSTSVRDDAPERDDVTNPEGAPVALALVSSSGGPALVHAFTPLQDCPTPGDVPDSGGSGTAGATVEQESSTPRCDATDMTSPAPPTDTPDPNAQAD